MNPRIEPITFRELGLAESFVAGGFAQTGSNVLPLALTVTVRGCFKLFRRS